MLILKLIHVSKRGHWTQIKFCHQLETFSALLALCAGNSPATGEFPAKRPVTQSFDVFLDLRLNYRLSEQSSGWWFKTQSRPLWRHCKDEGMRSSSSQRAHVLVFRTSVWRRHTWSRVPDVFSTWLNVWNCNSKYFKAQLKTYSKR